MTAEPAIDIQTREQLLHTLAEAAEIEHNLMCCYLYAAWSLRTEDDDDLPADLRHEMRQWSGVITSVAIDEMTHLALVCNLMHAVGGQAHFDRPNFPIAPGYHPSDMTVHLAPFDAETLQHFIFFERPEGNDEPDGKGFEPMRRYRRGLNGLKVMPSSQDFETVGHLYRSIAQGLTDLSERLGETLLFCGDPALQVDDTIVSLTGLAAITDLASARRAIETIVEQGEGAAEATANGHFQRFLSIRQRLETITTEQPDFSPALPAAINPVMRKPPQSEGRVWINNPSALAVLDVANALYGQMLRCLFVGFAASVTSHKKRMIDAAVDLMEVIGPLGRELARMRANDTDGCNAGMSFATLRSVATPLHETQNALLLAERLGEILAHLRDLPDTPRIAVARIALERLMPPQTPNIDPKPSGAAPAAGHARGEKTSIATAYMPETADGRDISITFNGRRCIHARFCVLGAPNTFLANVDGPWLHPDATPVENLVEIAHACPSGAITYRRKDGQADEAPPEVNVARVRENGPYAFHGRLFIDGTFIGYRATLCRCGHSKRKPFCDGSHHAAGFSASGEIAVVDASPLERRDGRLDIQPQRNGPLQIAGNLEICSGGGSTIQRVTSVRLCRCGQSLNKPFCDGSHRRVGFEAPAGLGGQPDGGDPR